MNITDLQRRLIAAARAQVPDERVPYAFEKRIMARLPRRVLHDATALWARALWRAAGTCVAIMLALGAWSYFTPRPVVPNNDLSQAFETALLAAADQDPGVDSTW